MDKWVDHVAEQDATDTNLKSEQDWESLMQVWIGVSFLVTKKETSKN